MKYPILSAYNTFNTAPIALWSFDAAGNLASDRPDLPPALLIDSVCRAVERSQNGPQESLLLTGGYVTFPVTPLLDVGTEDFSVCAWIRTGDLGIVKIIDKRIQNSGPLRGWALFLYQGQINLQIADGKSWVNSGSEYYYTKIDTFPVISDNQWHHVGVAVDRDRLDGGRWYVDGKEVDWRFNPTGQQSSLRNSMPLTVGRRSDDFGGIYRGNIGDMRLYKQALSAADVLSIYRSIQSPINNKFFVNILKRPEIPRPEQDSFSESDSISVERYSQAMEYYQESLNIHRNNGNGYGEANSLNNLGNIYSARGEYSQAIDYHQQALNIQQDIGNSSGEAESLNALGSIYDALGEYLQAIECHQQCLNIYREIGHFGGIATSWRDLGSAYHSLGEYQQAIECQLQSLDMARKINSKHRELNCLNALGRTYVSLGENQLAIEYCEKSLNLAPKIDNRYGEANSLVILGNAYSNLGHYLRAIAFYKQSLDIQQEIGDRSGEATSCRNLGNAYRCLGQYQRAIEYSRKSLEIARAIGETASEGATLNNLGLALFDFGKFAEAETVLGDAIQTWESLRGKLSDRDNFKVSIFETQAATYRHLEKTLIVQKKTKQALEIAERGRARAFVELLGARLSANSDAIPDIKPPNINRIQEIAQAQNATFVEYSISFLEELFIWVIQPTGEIAFRQVDINYEHTSLKELVADSREAIGIRNRDFNPTLKMYPGDLVKLHDDAPNWEPWQVISVDKTHNILSLCQSSWPAGLTIKRPAIDVAAKVESSLTNHPRLQKLHQLLIEPIADLLPTDPAAKIIFIPQGELFFVPFPALQDAAGKYLIEKHTILTAPAIQILELTSQKRQEISNLAGDILVVGNPTMPEVALVPGQPPQQLSALPHSETEANAIAQLFQTQALTGKFATKSAVLQRLSDARIVHFATHGLLDRTRGLGSAIAFAPDRTDSGLLTAEEILHLHLQADLVVLSACNTGMGRITGDGVIGLSRALISAGTSSAIVSLWAVPDAPTADLMVKFYQNLDRTGNKAQALCSAMLETMQQHPNPRDWAAFTLIGEASTVDS
ncbi:MAG: CHAT domain-containing protein [Microcoleus sp. PH2017_01_SCD_O_A]|uniref:CHAT domain-containing protein n=1 Tax=Microcoleus sp. PH2017_01_SCD_O_A TaxID=2798812 RepID=UPI001D8489CD|nr:CHAT domain-containing protein [Microcoleus sp. PH2017_01_SCD_O_A]MCC3427013.1 CHAT domain-containing protein [Microcoleus sp. PH2017_01_SCD_O_A]